MTHETNRIRGVRSARLRMPPPIDPFAARGDLATGGELLSCGDDFTDSLEDLHYRLEGRRLRVLYLEHSGAPRVVLESARSGVAQIEQAIELRIRSIQVRRNLDEKLLLDELRPLTSGAGLEESADESSAFDTAPCEPSLDQAGSGQAEFNQLQQTVSSELTIVERVVASRIQQIALANLNQKRSA